MTAPRRIDTPELDSLDYGRWRGRDGETTFYLSEGSADGAPPLLCIQGSGCESVIRKTSDGRWRLGLHGFLRTLVVPQWTVMAVEKPGVPCLHQTDTPGASVGCPDEFVRDYRFERWLDTLEEAVRSALLVPGMGTSRLAVVGESEGALMAAHLAARLPEVTDVALVSPTAGPQLAEFVDEQGRGTAEERHQAVEELFAQFERMLANPESTDDWWWGHPFQRWATFGVQSTLDGLRRTDARVLLAYGTEDATAGADRLRAGLVAAGKDVTALRIVGGDHQLTVRTAGAERDIRDAVGEIVSWLGSHERS